MVRSSDVRWFTKGILAVALVGLAACSEQPMGLLSGPTFGIQSGSGSGNPSVSWTGRSGSAAIMAYALFDASTSATNLIVTSYRATDEQPTDPVGCINKIQVKVYNLQGRLVSTQNFNGLEEHNVEHSVSVPVRGAQVGYRLALHVNVSCIDRNRTDVVTADVVVIPAESTDPMVVDLSVPGGFPLVEEQLQISAHVTVPAGGPIDLKAATGNCALTLTRLTGAGAPSTTTITKTPAVTVLPGHSEICDFTPTVASPGGQYQVTVSFENVSPYDLNLANNRASTQLVVYLALPTWNMEASNWEVSDATVAYHDGTTSADWAKSSSGGVVSWFPDSASALDSVRYPTSTLPLLDSVSITADRVGNEQRALFAGIIGAEVKFPLVRVTVSQSTPALDGTSTNTLHSRTWPTVAADPGSGAGSECATLLGSSAGTSPAVTLRVCADQPIGSNLYGQTRIDYSRVASAVTAGGNSQYQVDPANDLLAVNCHPELTDPTNKLQCFTNSTALGPALVPFGSTYTFLVEIQDALRTYSATITVPLVAESVDLGYPSSCGYSAYPYGDNGWIRSFYCGGLVNTSQGRGGAIGGSVFIPSYQ